MPNDVDPLDHIKRKTKWRSEFRGRLTRATDFLQGNRPITSAQKAHIDAFAQVLYQNPIYKNEVENLTSIEFEILCIASTYNQAMRDAEFFVVSELEVTFSDGFVKAERRKEVRETISKNIPFLESIYGKTQSNGLKAQDENRIKDIKEWLSCTSNNRDIQYLVNLLVAHLAEDNHTPGPEEPQHFSFSISKLTLSPPRPLFLNDDQRTILGLIQCAGGQVPRCFFAPAMVWTTLGEPGLNTITVPEVLDDEERTEMALQSLLDSSILLSNKENDTLMVNPEVSSQTEQDVDHWRVTTLAATCRAFPEWPHLLADPVKCRSLIPIVRNVLSYLPRVSLGHELQSNLMGMCISASFFGSLSWKGSMLKIASGLSTGDTVTSHKLGMRIRMLYRLLRRNDTPVEVLDPHLFINNPRSNAQYGEQIILEMQVLLDQRASIGDIEENFAKFIPGHPKSTQERQVSLRGEEIIIKAMRFQGRLEDAKERYVELMTQYRKDSIPARFTASFAELLCDLGDTQRALHILGSEFDYRNKGAGRRLEMAVSQAHLTKGLWDFAREKFGEESRSSLNLARARFRSTINSLEGEGLHRLCQTNRGHYFVACAGLAMIEHISALILIREGAIPHCASVEKQLKTALQAWHTAHFAHEAARASWSGQGYSEVVILFSKSQLLHHLRDPGAKQVMDLAKQKHIQIGRHFHVVAHGTVWLQILKLCPDMDGRGRMAFWEVALNERER